MSTSDVQAPSWGLFRLPAAAAGVWGCLACLGLGLAVPWSLLPGAAAAAAAFWPEKRPLRRAVNPASRRSERSTLRRAVCLSVTLTALLTGVGGIISEQSRRAAVRHDLEQASEISVKLLTGVRHHRGLRTESALDAPDQVATPSQCEAAARVLSALSTPGRGESSQSVSSGSRIMLRFPCPAGGESAEGAPDMGEEIKARVLSARKPLREAGPYAARVVTGQPHVLDKPWYAAIRQARAASDTAFAASASEGTGRLGAAMVYGGETSSDSAESWMKAAGLSHLTSVSGANCAIVTLAAVGAARLARRGIAGQTAALGGALIVFTLLCGPEPSVLRAAVMGALSAVGFLAGRPGSMLSLLALAVLALLAWDPWLALDLGFQLSAAATGGIILWASPLQSALTRLLPNTVAAPLSVSAAAAVGCHPIIAYISDNVPGLSLAANVAVSPVVAPVTLLGFLAVAVSWASSAAGEALAWLPNRGADLVLAVARISAESPANQTELPLGWAGAFTGLIGWGLAAWLVRRASRQKKEHWQETNPVRRSTAGLLLLVAGLVAAAILWTAPPLRPVAGNWQTAMCDVGQGDAVVLRAGVQEAVLVDVGPQGGRISRCLDQLGVKRVKAVFITHLHADHSGGLDEALRGRGEPPVYYSTARPLRQAHRALGHHALRSQKVEGSAEGGRRVLWSESGLKLILLQSPPPAAGAREEGPGTGRSQGEGSVENGASLVILAESEGPGGRLRTLLTGDIERGQDAETVKAVERLEASGGIDVLKVPHHGARNGAKTFWRRAHPRVALIGVGAGNSYGHPHRATLDELAALGATVRRTDRDGLITVAKDRENILVQSSR